MGVLDGTGRMNNEKTEWMEDIDPQRLENAVIYYKMLERDDYQCQICRIRDWRHPIEFKKKNKSFLKLDPLDQHHIIPEGIGGKTTTNPCN